MAGRVERGGRLSNGDDGAAVRAAPSGRPEREVPEQVGRLEAATPGVAIERGEVARVGGFQPDGDDHAVTRRALDRAGSPGFEALGLARGGQRLEIRVERLCERKRRVRLGREEQRAIVGHVFLG